MARSASWSLRGPATAMVVAAALFIVSGVLFFWSLRSLDGDIEWVDHTHQVLEELGGILQASTDSRVSALAFAGSGAPRELDRVLQSSRAEGSAVDHVAALTADNARQRDRVVELRRLAQMDAAWQSLVVRSRSRSVARSAAEAASSRRDVESMQRTIAQMQEEERGLLRQRQERQRRTVRRTLFLAILGGLVILALVAAAVMMSRKALVERGEAEARLAAANAELTQRVRDLQQRSAELTMLGTLGESLQTCELTSDIDHVIERIVPALWPRSSGAVYLVVRSTEIVPQVAWPSESAERFAPFQWQECLGLSRFTLHRAGEAGTEDCPHAKLEKGEAAVCVPMLARGEPIGLMHVRWTQPATRVEELVRTVAEQLALAYANLNLHETLRRQAIRDPLTGVFNRRYMEESLEREIHRAARHNKPLAVLLLDLDHFKEYNDALGHAAGDELLHELSALMVRIVRGEDIVCRYGGDEFVIIMPDADARVVASRAQTLMDHVAGRSDPSGSGITVTSSIGVALFPNDGADAKTLLKAADGALYLAKRQGRGRMLHA